MVSAAASSASVAVSPHPRFSHRHCLNTLKKRAKPSIKAPLFWKRLSGGTARSKWYE